MPDISSFCLFRSRTVLRALALLLPAAALAADSAADAFRQARACLASNRFAEAAGLYKDAAASTNADAAAAAWLGRGEALFGAKQWPEAAASYNKLLADFPESPLAPNALCGRGFAEAKSDQMPQALATFQAFLARYPKHALAAAAAASTGTISRALVAREKQRAEESLARDTAAINACVRGERYREAAEAAERFLQAHPGAASVADVHLLAAECAFRAEDYPRAEAAYRRFLSLHAGHAQAAHAWLGLGKTLQALSRYDEAADAFARANDAGQAGTLQAACLARAGRHGEALSLYAAQLQASTNKQEQARITLAMGDCLAAQQKWSEAERLYLSVEALLASEALRPVALERLAGLYERAGQTNQAARAREELRRRYPALNGRP